MPVRASDFVNQKVASFSSIDRILNRAPTIRHIQVQVENNFNVTFVHILSIIVS
jgi:hypothetical protein